MLEKLRNKIHTFFYRPEVQELLAEESQEADPVNFEHCQKPKSFVVFDTKRRVFITKIRMSSVALYCPDSHRLMVVDENKQQQWIDVNFSEKKNAVFPLSGLWKKNCEAGFGLYFPETGEFSLKNDVFGQSEQADYTFEFGPEAQTWLPISGDWDADGVSSIGLYDRAKARFYLQNKHQSHIKADIQFNFGPRHLNWLGVAGDWNGNGQTTVGLYDPDHGIAMLQNQHQGSIKPDIRFKIAGVLKDWQPIIGDWGQNGIDSFAFWDNENSQFYLKYQNDNGGFDDVIAIKHPGETVIPVSFTSLV